MRIILTGASGFVGRRIVSMLSEKEDYQLVAAVRNQALILPGAIASVDVPAIDERTDWRLALDGVGCIIHCAARVHMMNDDASDPLAEFRRVNTAGTLNFARQAAALGVRRFIFVSSIKVNGEGTIVGRPYTADDMPAPVDAYGISKMEAEIGLKHIAAETGMEVVIIRPVLVYGPGVRANFLSMMRWLSRGIPLPLGGIHNARSLVALDNLVDLISTCIDHPAAANQTFLVSDGEDLSTSELLRRMAAALGRKAWLIPVPAMWLEFLASLLGGQGVAQRLCGSLQVDIGKTRKLLQWSPPFSVDDSLRKTAAHFRKG